MLEYYSNLFWRILVLRYSGENLKQIIIINMNSKDVFVTYFLNKNFFLLRILNHGFYQVFIIQLNMKVTASVAICLALIFVASFAREVTITCVDDTTCSSKKAYKYVADGLN